jgi:hypothetical protein
MTVIKKLVLFGVMIVVTVIILKIFNWIPVSLQKDGIRRYTNLEDVKNSFSIGRLYLPSYFPQYLKWPPEELYGQKKPYVMVLTQFVDRETGSVALSIRQTESGHPETLKSRIEPYKVNKQAMSSIKGRQAQVFLGRCRGGERCNSVRWQGEGFNFEVVASDSEKELLKIAESMLSE